MNLNKAIIIGRLTQDPETRTLPSGQPVCSFSMATNRMWTAQDGNRKEATEYHNIVVFGKLADICSKYLNKGRLIMIEGRIQTRSWEGKDGNRRYRTEIVAENMQMGPRPGGAAGQGRSNIPDAPQKESTPPSQEEIPIIEAEEPIEEEKTDNKFASSEQEEGSSSSADKVDVKNIPF